MWPTSGSSETADIEIRNTGILFIVLFIPFSFFSLRFTPGVARAVKLCLCPPLLPPPEPAFAVFSMKASILARSRMARILPSIIFFLLCFSHGASAAAGLSQEQARIMLNLSNSIPSGAGGWRASSPAADPCAWDGVTCSSSPPLVVTGLSFSDLGLAAPAGDFFRSICLLATLQSLDLSLNRIATLPDYFTSGGCAAAAGLRSLNLSGNRLSSLPARGFTQFIQLRTLDLSSNQLNGSLAASQFAAMARLRSLNLSSNTLSGPLPPFAGHPELEELVLSSNRFGGPIPEELFQLQNLTVLDLSQNYLDGNVPDRFAEFRKLETLLLSANHLDGPIPASLSSVKTLSRFAAYQNSFAGPIPDGITENIRVLDLSYNKLSGEIPAGFFAARGLEYVDLTGNSIRGSIPANLSSSLYRLRLGGNSLTGSIPASIGGLFNLAYLELEENELQGGVPPALGKCANLTLLNLAGNRLVGSVPPELGNLRSLVVLKLQMNNLSGGIPSEIFALENLSTLNLSRNALSGEVPRQISRLRKLSNLNLQGNNLRGKIPDTIAELTLLIELQLGSNMLNGTVPKMPTSLTIALNLSDNLLSGPIPPDLGSLADLEILDLSHNNFSGEVPGSLAGLQSLTQLILSHNQLSGVLPSFPPWVKVVTFGNELDSGGTPAGRRRSSAATVITVIAAVGGFFGFLALATAIVFILTRRRYHAEHWALRPEESLPQIVNGRFITSNSIHVSSIDFSKAMEAVSDHGKVFLKTRFCTYYRAEMLNGAVYSVKKLNWSDKAFNVGSSQEKFGHELEAIGRLSSSNVMLPLAYVLTEDSAFIFYEHLPLGTVFNFLHSRTGNVLDWPSRYSIALGVAQGLTFLHGCAQPVLLLDLSTRTVHLKTVKEPQIGDIELCKVIDPSKSTGSLSTVAGTVGYIPPEYAYTMRLTAAGNVYSFGVILLELITGKPAVTETTELANWALNYSGRRPDEQEEILDDRVSQASPAIRGQMLSVLNIALACVAVSPEARPKMRSVSRMLLDAK